MSAPEEGLAPSNTLDPNNNDDDAAATTTRVRRSTVKKIDYSKEQEFSDADLFEDSPNEDGPHAASALAREAAAAPTKRRVRRVKTGTSSATPQASGSASRAVLSAAGGATATELVDDDGPGGLFYSRPIYTEKGYDPNLPPIRERFPFLPEYEEDGSPKIELIVGRRPVDENEDAADDLSKKSDDDDHDNDQDDEDHLVNEDADSDDHDDDTVEAKGGSKKGRRTRRRTTTRPSDSTSPPLKKKENGESGPVEYEYLIKYRGRSYLHLEWKSGADLESMNKSAKGIYRRYLKKLAQGSDEDLENPEFDPSYVVPEKILDEADQEITVELTDKELLRWEKQREMELAEVESDDGEGVKDKVDQHDNISQKIPAPLNGESGTNDVGEEEKKENTDHDGDYDWVGDEIDFGILTIDRLRAILNREGPYYAKVPGSDNPYRDGYVTEPPRKPRASYLFFQCAMRSFFAKKYPGATQAELMTLIGNYWQTMSDANREAFLQLAKEEAQQYEKEKILLAKAQKPNEVWQPMRRCLMVLDRLSKDSFADIFLEPVNTSDFPDYEEVIDSPMDLATVRQRLQTRKYQVPEQFARDMRKIWNNCKIYNQHGSAIWHVADYMSKQFERLYHAWVLEFRERYIRWSDPRSRPWEHTCRRHDGSCKTTDDLMVLCDHCDAMYGIRCLQPPLKKIPTKAWHCPDCKPKLKTAKGIRMLSAVAENAARKRAELGDLPRKKVKQTMFLVKWAGLGYEFCTWETRADINDDRLIAEFRKVNSSSEDETEMPAEAVDKVLEQAVHTNEENAGGSSSIPLLRSQLYAQTRLFHFAKFGMSDLPDSLCSECGPKTKSVFCLPPFDSMMNYEMAKQYSACPREVVECVDGLVLKVARREAFFQTWAHSSLPPPMTGEYDVIIPITSRGLMMNVGEVHGSVAFLGYRQFPDGSKGPAELSNLIRNAGDKIIAVDGVSTVGKSFKDVIDMLRESGKNKYAYMRFLENRYSSCDTGLVSVGSKGLYAIEVLQTKFVSDRQRMCLTRQQNLLRDEQEPIEENDEDESSAEPGDSDNESGDGGEFRPESDDDEGDGPKDPRDASEDGQRVTQLPQNSEASQNNTAVSDSVPGNDLVRNEDFIAEIETKYGQGTKLSPRGVICREETTQSLAYRLLDINVGYSSDEGGDEDCAFFVDGVDQTFSRREELSIPSHGQKLSKENIDSLISVPAKQSEFTAFGDRAKLAAAVVLSCRTPEIEDFETYPLPAKSENNIDFLSGNDDTSPSKVAKRSTVKIEQLSISTGETLHVWANVEAAAATLQLPLPALRQVLRGEYDEDIGDEVGGFKWRYALAGAKVTAGASTSTRGGGGKKAKEAWLQFRDKLYDPTEPHVYKNGNRLRDYQVDGVNWLSSTWYKQQGCILADEMGLGKTVQIVCYLEHLFRVEKIRRPYLVVVPLSTIEHWRREFEGWTDMVCCIYHDRQRVWRDVLREYEWYFEDRPHTPEFLKFDVLVTTYDTLIGDFDVISQIPFRVTVVDEAHRLRNQKGKLLECMKEISAKGTMQYGFQSRVLMSGTPLQNDLTELWTLLNFIEPFKFPDLSDFLARFGNMANREQVETLQQMISPCMLRRVKEDVAKDIPAKEETVIDVELTSIQKQYYRAIFEHNHAFLNMGATRQNTPKLMNIQMELRKVCNHVWLLDGVEHREMDRIYKEFSEKGLLLGKAAEEQQHLVNEHGYIMSSGKMILLDKLLPKLRQEGHKVLIFSQMVKMLDLISEYCEFRSFRYERLDGRVRGTERQKAIDRFEREPDSFVFLLSTRAGGVGINLTAADICIIFDSDWNPQNDIQAQARCHRIGQTKDVRIYRLITSRSFEQEMFDRASKKLGLEQAVLGTFEKDGDDGKPTQEEMEQLLKRGAYALLEDENDEITNEFCADDIESILAKRTRTRVVEGAKTASWLNKQGMVVSKSKFSAESGGVSLDVDDPLFWQKVMPDFITPGLMLQKFHDLQDEVEGTVRGPGRGRKRGRGRPKKIPESKVVDVVDRKDDANENDKTPTDIGSGEDVEDETEISQPEAQESQSDAAEDQNETERSPKKGKIQLSRAHIRKIQKYMSDLKSMMEGIFEEDDDEDLSSDEKNILQKLLLTISMKEKIFNEEQRLLARAFLKRIEGDRRRRCRTTEQRRFTPGHKDEETGAVIPEDLRIVSSKKRKKRRRRTLDEDDVEAETPDLKRRKRTSDVEESGYLGEDGYKHHSDSEDDWSDVGEDMYGRTKKEKISVKEARRRRQWAAEDDDVTAAGRAWPVFPRNFVKKVLTTVLDEMMNYDAAVGGVFSEPVSIDEFPEYYEQIKNPMDYSTMRKKLENGEYRSAQAMQKDFILMLQNCRQFNAKNSDIVREAREQHLMRPKLLKDAAAKHGLFLAEDGSVLQIYDDDEKKSVNAKKKGRKPRKDSKEEQTEPKGRKREKSVAGNSVEIDSSSVISNGDDSQVGRKAKIVRRRKGNKNGVEDQDNKSDDGQGESTRPRIRIKVKTPVAIEKENSSTRKPTRKLVRTKNVSHGNIKNEVGDENPVVNTPKLKHKAAENPEQSETAIKLRRKRKNSEVDETQETPVPEKQKAAIVLKSKRKSQEANVTRKAPSRGVVPAVEHDIEIDEASMFNPAALKIKRESLDGSFESSMQHLRSHGPWKLPPQLEDRFDEVALATLSKMDRYDRYEVFAEAVSEEEAPGYYDVVKNPMDFGTMKKKVKARDYGNGSGAAAAMFKDFRLIFENCAIYNPEDSEVLEEAARVLSLLPEAYAVACTQVMKRKAQESS